MSEFILGDSLVHAKDDGVRVYLIRSDGPVSVNYPAFNEHWFELEWHSGKASARDRSSDSCDSGQIRRIATSLPSQKMLRHVGSGFT